MKLISVLTWGVIVDSLDTTTYFWNRLPTKTITISCPYIALYNTPPTYEHF
jgi:hypothetical protein